jgi:L-iditol 2-dehydrogenase
MGARVIVADPIPRRREIANKLGAEAIDPSNRGAEQIIELTGGKGADLVVECAGHDASIASVFDYACQDGRISMVGINIGRKISSNMGLMQLKNLTIRGCIGSPGVWPAAIRFLEKTGIDLSPIQTHKFSLDDAVKGFELGQDPKACIKITLTTGAKH